MASCQQETLQIPVEETESNSSKREYTRMKRMKFQSPEQIQCVIGAIENASDEKGKRRVLAANTEYSNGSEEFVSLYEANKNAVFSKLTQEEWDIINNDEDELEFEPTDSIIADIRFAQLLNADREIQMRDSVYRYFHNGVAVTNELYASELDSIYDVIANIVPDPANGPSKIKPRPNVDFYPIAYDQTIHPFQPNIGETELGGGAGFSSIDNCKNGPLQLKNGVSVPTADIREVDYYSKGDGNWLHRLWTGIWGRNIVVLSKFEKNRQLNLNFYDQNYLIYSNIGTKIKMQKKVCGIWWNVKAEEMVHGWEMVCLDFTMPKPIIPQFPKDSKGNPIYPTHFPHHFPFQDESEVLFHIPLIDFDFTNKNMNDAFKKACDLVWSRLQNSIKSSYKRENVGLFSIKDPHSYLFCGPNYITLKNKKSHESKFYAQWFPGNYQFGFNIGSGLKLMGIKIDGNDNVALDSGIVFGAIKYKGKWKAARIVKMHKD